MEAEFKAEQIALEKRLNEIVEDVMGDTPINLNSGIDRTKVVYSRTVIDQEAHKRIFNIGVGPTGKPLRAPRMNKAEFANSVRTSTAVIQKTMAVCCDVCDGRGRIKR